MTTHTADTQPKARPGWWKPLAAVVAGAALLIALALYFQGVFAQGLRHWGGGWVFLVMLAWSFAAMKFLMYGIDAIVSRLREPNPDQA